MTDVPICSANRWTDFYMIGTSVMKELNLENVKIIGAFNTQSNI